MYRQYSPRKRNVLQAAVLLALGLSGVHLGAEECTHRDYCTTSNPLYEAGYGGQCTSYVWGRAYEKFGLSLSTVNDANTWNDNTNLPTGDSIRQDSIAVWDDGDGGVGHVGYVEAVVGDNVLFTEANFSTYNKNNGNYGGGYDGDVEILSLNSFKKRGDYKIEKNGYIYLSANRELPDDLASRFDKAYNANGGEAKLGKATNKIHCWSDLTQEQNPSCDNGVWIRDYQKDGGYGDDGHTALIFDTNSQRVFLMKEGFWGYYKLYWGYSRLGAPTSKPFTVDGKAYQTFEKGTLKWNPEPDSGETIVNWGLTHYNRSGDVVDAGIGGCNLPDCGIGDPGSRTNISLSFTAKDFATGAGVADSSYVIPGTIIELRGQLAVQGDDVEPWADGHEKVETDFWWYLNGGSQHHIGREYTRVRNLKEGKTHSEKVRYTVPNAPGSVLVLEACTDTEQEIREYNEGDQCGRIALKIVTPEDLAKQVPTYVAEYIAVHGGASSSYPDIFSKHVVIRDGGRNVRGIYRPGEAIQVHTTLINAGAENTAAKRDRKLKTQYKLSSGVLPQANPWIFETDKTRTTNLEDSGETHGETGTIPAGSLVPGVYNAAVCTDTNDKVEEGPGEANNCTPPIVFYVQNDLPDVAVVSAMIDGNPLVTGESYDINAAVSSLAGEIRLPVKVTFSIDLTEIGSQVIQPSELPASMVIDVSLLDWQVPSYVTAGAHTINVCATYEKVGYEANTANNCFGVPVTVEHPEPENPGDDGNPGEPSGCVFHNPVAGAPVDPNGPDFVINSIWNIPSVLSRGQTIHPHTVVQNVGASAGGSRLGYYVWSCDGSMAPLMMDGDSQDGLRSGESESEEIKKGWVVNLPPGTYRFAACANIYGMGERTTANNCGYTDPVTVQ